LGKIVLAKAMAPKFEAAGNFRDVVREADRLILNKYTRPSVLINDQMEIIQFRGDTGPFLAPSPGIATLNLFNMLRDGLLGGVRTLLAEAEQKKSAQRKENLKMQSNQMVMNVSVEVVPFEGAGQRFFLVIFEEDGGSNRKGGGAAKSTTQKSQDLHFQE